MSFRFTKPIQLKNTITLPDGKTGITGLVGACFQVAPGVAAIAINLRMVGKNVCDFELGHDIYLFESPERIFEHEPLTFLRAFGGKHIEDGSDIFYSRYDGTIGFVPEGATLPDGRPHPHAGTGFCIGTAIALPAEVSQGKHIDVYGGNKGFFMFLTQLEYRNGTLRQKSLKIMRDKDFIPGGVGCGLGAPVFDGEDILLPYSTAKPADFGLGLLRMKRGPDGDWGPGGFEMIAPEKGDCPPLFTHPSPGDGLSGCEPSAARIANGEIVFTCREWGDKPWDPEPLAASRVRLWRGRPFRQVYEKPFFHTLSPITVSATWAGVPYLLANPYTQVSFRGKQIPSLNLRETLLLYPLEGENLTPGEPVVLCDSLKEFGNPGPDDACWFVDHPMGWRLNPEGRNRDFVTWRVFNLREAQGKEPSPYSAAWITELV